MNPRMGNRISKSTLLAASLALLLLACGGNRHAVHPRAEELPQLVLIIEESNGQLSHSWQQALEFDLSRDSRADKATGSIMLAAARPRDCDQEQVDCYRNCMKSRLPSYLNHIKRGDGGKDRHCAQTCLNDYMRCLKLQDRDALEFSSAGGAAEWLKQNRAKILVGSIVIIAGVAFVALSAGAGLVVLAPIVLVAG